MTLSSALSAANSGLRTTSYRAEIAAGNVANANTPGYVRREAISSEAATGGQGSGVRIAGVQRHQDLAVTALRRDADASLARSDALAQTFNQLNINLGTPDSEFGLFASFQGLESTMRELSATPESSVLQASVLGASADLVNQFHSLSELTNSLRESADMDIARDVETVNSALHRLSELNGSIVSSGNGTGEAAALEDERQGLIDTISEIIPVQIAQRENGRIELLTKEGVYLLSTQVNEVTFNPANAIPPTSQYNDGSGQLSGLTVGDQDITPGAGGNFSLSSGSLSGYFSVRDTIVPKFNEQLDSMASDLIRRFSDDGLDPTKAAGAPGIFTDAGAALDPLNTTGIASRIALNAAIDPSQGGSVTRFRDGLGALTTGPEGNADILNGYLDAMNTASAAPSGSGITGTYSFSELLAGFTSTVGENRVRNDAINSSALVRQNLYSDAEIQASGVDTDVEMQALLIIEQSYAANARVIQVVSDMLDRLMQI